MDLSIIIINWNSARFLEKCIRSIQADIKIEDYEIIVLDNASYDGSEAIVTGQFPGVRFIQNDENTGFAQANNLAFTHSSGRYLLFLNPDTEIVAPAIDTIFSAMESDPGVGAAGCKLLNTDGTMDTSCVQPFPTIANQVFDLEVLKRSRIGLSLWRSNPLALDGVDASEVDVIIGACIMIRRGIFEDIGGFSTDYFMYAEDIDLCYKVRRAGYKVLYLSASEVIHHGGGSTKEKQRNDFKTIMMREAVLKFLRKTRGGTYAGLYRASLALASVSRLALILVMLPPSAFSKRYNGLKFSYYKWLKVLRWSVGLEGWTREYY